MLTYKVITRTYPENFLEVSFLPKPIWAKNLNMAGNLLKYQDEEDYFYIQFINFVRKLN